MKIIELVLYCQLWFAVGFLACYFFVKKHTFKVDIEANKLKRDSHKIPSFEHIPPPPKKQGLTIELVDLDKYRARNIFVEAATDYDIEINGEFMIIKFRGELSTSLEDFIKKVTINKSDFKAIY